MDDIAQIRLELEQMKLELALDASGPIEPAPRPARQSRLCVDFGLFVLLYFFWLITIVTAELAAGMGIHPLTALAVLPCVWLSIALLRKAPLQMLLVAVAGALLLAAAAYGVSLLYDTSAESNTVYKPVTGMLMNGWNPFRQRFAEFANTHAILPYNDSWSAYGLDSQPKAAFMIGAAVYALTGSIESGKMFSLIAMIACVCIAAPLLKDAFKLSRGAAFLAAILAAVNPVTLSQLALYYTDGFAFQLLTVAAVSFVYLLVKPDGAMAFTAKLAAFLAVGIAVSLSALGAVYAAILMGVFILARVVQIIKSNNEGERAKPLLSLAIYLAAMIVCAVFVLGAPTYLVNLLRNGNPFAGMFGQTGLGGAAAGRIGLQIAALPLIAQFFGSLFSPVSNGFFTQVDLKIPLAVSRTEWLQPVMDATVSGWGILFGGICILSALIVLITAIRMFRRSPGSFWLLLGLLLVVILPAALIPGLFIARSYLQPFWLPMAALICLLAPAVDDGEEAAWLRVLRVLLATGLCVLLIVNAYTGTNDLRTQVTQTAADRAKMDDIQNRIAQDDAELGVTTIARGQFYGLFLNLRDEGVNYAFLESLPMIQDELLYHMVYAFRARGSGQDAQAESFLNTLYANGYLVAVAANAGSPLTERMTALLQAVGLMTDGPADPNAGYLAVIDADGNVLTEQSGFESITVATAGTSLRIETSAADVSVTIGGTDYGNEQRGFHIVVYDPVNAAPVDSVLIDSGADPVLTVYPVRIAAETE
ncbi:MAG TPA: hypothetical protein PKU80_04855 [Candidatus Limiplasma sp.]|nr:hypothetical protein [Candidatus Limiplasma sp.]HRX08729.1 hypothetical protein [Candidatus Limiplasma sp.]